MDETNGLQSYYSGPTSTPFKAFSMLIGGIIVLIAVVAGLIAAWNTFLAGVSFLISLLVVLAVVTIPVVLFVALLYVWRAKQHEQAHRQELARLDRELREAQLEALRVEAQVRARTVNFDSQGNAALIDRYGDIVQLRGNMREHPQLSSFHDSRKVTSVSEEKPAALALPMPEDRLPDRVRYEDVVHQVPRGHALLGLDARGVVTCEFGKLMTCWIVGGSSTGKSNTVALKIDEAIRNGKRIKLLVIDPHMKKEDSLYNKIKGYSRYFAHPVARTEEEILRILDLFLAEFERRTETGDCSFDLLLIVDEVSNVVESEDEEIARKLKKIARICGQESRGFGMFGWFISQKAAGLAWLRNVVITVIAHKLNMFSERKLACNEDTALARSMDGWPVGRVVVYGLGFEEIRVLQMPVFSPPTGESQPLPEQKAFPLHRETGNVQTPGNGPETFAETGPETSGDGRLAAIGKIIEGVFSEGEEPSTKKEAIPAETWMQETISRMKKAGEPDRKIAAYVGLSGRRYGEYQRICRVLGLKSMEEA